jgi:hypothetical protein
LGLVEVDGEEKFVLAVYEDLKGLIKNRIQNAPLSAAPTSPSKAVADAPEKLANNEGKKRRVPKRGGPSCADRIIALKATDFFKTSRGVGEIRDGLKNSGHNYASNQVGASLESLHGRGELRRSQGEAGKWVYTNP